jgi:predicted acetyltransferase
MSDRNQQVKHIWQERFNDSKIWMTEVFTRVYNEHDALTLEVDNKVVSHLILRQYLMRLGKMRLPMAYIYGAATARAAQGRGYMTQLMHNALNEAQRRGDIIVSLIPARRRLFSFYSRFGFATAFFVDEQRYTSRHDFPTESPYYTVETTISDVDELANNYERLSSGRESTVLHTADDFKTIIVDNDVSSGLKALVRYKTGEIAAVAFATIKDKTLVVADLAAETTEAADLALGALKAGAGEASVVIVAPVGRQGVSSTPRAMARIVDVQSLLKTIAADRPECAHKIKVSDPIVRANNHTFVVAKGNVAVCDDYQGKLDLDVSIEVLGSILFSNAEMGEFFNFPSARPFMSLMLD